MHKPSEELIELRLLFPYKNPINYLGNQGLVPLLSFLETAPFPKPHEVEFSGKVRNRMRRKRINHYLDNDLLAILEPNGYQGTYIMIKSKGFSVFFDQMGISNQLVFTIDMQLLSFVTVEGLKKIFLDLLGRFPQTHIAYCSFAAYHSDFNKKHMYESGKMRNNYLRFLVWLQYLSAEELVIQGGISAFELNSLLKTERLNNGLLVEVGESPYDIFTDGGEALLAQATFSLPPVQYPSKV